MSLRNIAIIAHVDHGKTTLVDQLLKQSGTFRANQQVAERAMDSNDLERERGITILAKCTSVMWRDTRINIIDTPGHADFGGEVERILSMVDGVLLLVDAAEGPMPQTKFVTAKALGLGLRPIVLVNKIDRPDARGHAAFDEVFDLFAALEASDEQLDFPQLFASAKEGWAGSEPSRKDGQGMEELFDLILDHVPAPASAAREQADEPFSMLVTILESDPFLGRILTGRIESGTVRPNHNFKAINLDGEKVDSARVSKVLAFRGLERVSVDAASAGDIVALAGFSKATVSDTLCDPSVTMPIPADAVDPPTIAVTFVPNDSPFAGQDGDKVQSRVIRERLLAEAEGNVAIKIRETEQKDAFEVAGRGELQLGILIETMRREGFELSISRPRVLFREDPDTGARLEPIEEVQIDVDEEFSGIVIEKLAERRGELRDMRPSGAGKTRLVLHCPARGLIGYQGEFMTDTRGTGILYRAFHEYAPYKGPIQGRRNGVLIANSDGKSAAYALWNLEERGELLIAPGTQVYQGMIIGEHSRDNDLDVNPIKGKQLTNIRAAGKDDAVRLRPPRPVSLEQAIAYIDDDELVEVTPNHLRLRKRFLEPHLRKRAAKSADM